MKFFLFKIGRGRAITITKRDTKKRKKHIKSRIYSNKCGTCASHIKFTEIDNDEFIHGSEQEEVIEFIG